MPPKKTKSTKSPGSVYVIAGKDDFLVSNQCQSLIDDLLPDDQRAMALYQPGPNELNITDLLDELRTLPFLAQRRVVLVKDAEKFITDNRESLEKYFDVPAPKGVLILTVKTWMKSTRLAKKLPKIGELISIGEIKPAQLPAYVADYASQKHDKTLSRPTAGMLVEFVGDDPGRLACEIDKLAMYAGDSRTITAKHIESLIGHNRMFTAFSVIDALTAGNTAAALQRLRNMFATDKNANFTTVGAFAFHFRKMFNARAMLQQGTNINQIDGKLRIWYNKDAFFTQVRNTKLETLAKILQQLARIDYGIKTGQTTAPVAMETLLLNLAKDKAVS